MFSMMAGEAVRGLVALAMCGVTCTLGVRPVGMTRRPVAAELVLLGRITRVKRAVLTSFPSRPICPQHQTCPDPAGTSQKCQGDTINAGLADLIYPSAGTERGSELGRGQCDRT